MCNDPPPRYSDFFAGKSRLPCNALPPRRTSSLSNPELTMITNSTSGTNLHEIAPAIYRINTPIQIPGGPDFNFSPYLIADDAPLLFHTGPRGLFPLVAEAIGKVLPIERLRYIGFSHIEADECGSLNQLLAAAPQAVAV